MQTLIFIAIISIIIINVLKKLDSSHVDGSDNYVGDYDGIEIDSYEEDDDEYYEDQEESSFEVFEDSSDSSFECDFSDSSDFGGE